MYRWKRIDKEEIVCKTFLVYLVNWLYSGGHNKTVFGVKTESWVFLKQTQSKIIANQHV